MAKGVRDSGDDAGSPPCFLHELDSDGVPRVDPQQAVDVARWRKAERERLIAIRLELSAEYRAEQTSALTSQLDRLIPLAHGTIVSVYWPIRAEPDLRAWMRLKAESGLRVALPVALALGRPLVFREWRPGAPMARGLWKIPYPAEGAEVVPNVVLAPVVGFDPAGYRLGYGGGFFDRTLAQIASEPLVIGVGYPEAMIKTIFPQPHDIPMKWIATGAGTPLHRDPAI
ncbi:MAG TPA: 5-formyltetrahydrofolate cyclo-ligase [Steroidobacteraceae bacterium]|nr:5-formyltetrahydrofolate cyclo-ligase [Steroidobacteraceae bacterium]